MSANPAAWYCSIISAKCKFRCHCLTLTSKYLKQLWTFRAWARVLGWVGWEVCGVCYINIHNWYFQSCGLERSRLWMYVCYSSCLCYVSEFAQKGGQKTRFPSAQYINSWVSGVSLLMFCLRIQVSSHGFKNLLRLNIKAILQCRYAVLFTFVASY